MSLSFPLAQEDTELAVQDIVFLQNRSEGVTFTALAVDVTASYINLTVIKVHLNTNFAHNHSGSSSEVLVIKMHETFFF